MDPRRAEITQAAQLRTDPARADPDDRNRGNRNRKTRTRESRTRQRLPVKIYEAHAGGPSGQPAASSAGSWIGSDHGAPISEHKKGRPRTGKDTRPPKGETRQPEKAARRFKYIISRAEWGKI